MQKKKIKRRARKPIGFLLFVLVLLIGVVSAQISHLYQKNNALESEALRIEAEMQKALEEQTSLLEYKEYMNSTEYIEQLARDKFGLIKPNETLFITKTE